MADDNHSPEDHTKTFAEELSLVNQQLNMQKKRNETLVNLDMFVLDNSIRESTVGQLRGHTVENKFKIFEQVKKCGIKHIVVAAFSQSPRVDDIFVDTLTSQTPEEELSTYSLYAFTEVMNGVNSDGRPDETIPFALRKMKLLGLCNPIIEVDLVDRRVCWQNACTIEGYCAFLGKQIKWVRDHLSKDAKIFVNLRDFPFAMEKYIDRVLALVKYLASLPEPPFGLMYEDPTGRFSVGEMSAWTASVRQVMIKNGWESGHLLAHIHQKWGLAETVQLECLGSGADGVWASLCEEGAASGHACSTITIMNLVRLGNAKVLKKYNCTYLRAAAQEVTSITTGSDPHPKQIVYGDRAMDMVFDLDGIAGGKDDFDLGEFFQVSRPVRVCADSTTDFILKRLRDMFGESEQFTEQIAENMKEVMVRDLNDNRKEEYMSEAGLALLFDRSGGSIDEKMRDIINKVELKSEDATRLIKEVRVIWDEWDLKEDIDKQGDECLEFDSFYNAFMVPYFGCFRCDDTRKGLQAIDMDKDGTVEWSEFLVYLKWALNEYPEIHDVDRLLSVAFTKGLIPAMRDEVLRN